MRRLALAALWLAAAGDAHAAAAQQRLAVEAAASPPPPQVPLPVFASLERYARLVDITYCVGVGDGVGDPDAGVRPPFACASRCADFPELRLVTTWNTGVLMHDSCGFVAVDDGAREVVVAFRGTYSIANTVADLSTIPQRYVPYDGGGGGGDGNDGGDRCPNCTVHSGFLASWASTRRLVLPVVAAARNGTPPSARAAAPYRVHLVGHSLGGAVAALAALEMKTALGWADVQVTTFGEPRIGNAALAAFLEAVFGLNGTATAAAAAAAAAAYRRVTHRNDPVPLLPLADWGYSDHGGEIYIAKGSLPPAPADVRACRGRSDAACIAGDNGGAGGGGGGLLPPRLKLWELFFAHRDYFWRLGLCVPGGDPADWGRERYNMTGL